MSRVITASPRAVYDFAVEPENLPMWAAGLAQSQATRVGESLIVASPMGDVVTVTFCPRNELGVLDHDVRLPSGDVVHNPLRVVPHPDGAEVVFTIRQLGMPDQEFERDATLVEADLETLKRVIEARA